MELLEKEALVLVKLQKLVSPVEQVKQVKHQVHLGQVVLVEMLVNTSYITNKGTQCVLTLPSTASVGVILRVTGINASGWKITQNVSGIIHFGNADTTTGTGGYLESSSTRDSVELVCVVENNEWNVISSVGNITIV